MKFLKYYGITSLFFLPFSVVAIFFSEDSTFALIFVVMPLLGVISLCCVGLKNDYGKRKNKDFYKKRNKTTELILVCIAVFIVVFLVGLFTR